MARLSSVHCPNGESGSVAPLSTAHGVFAIEEGRCPSTHDELVSGRYLDRANLRDPWGTGVAFLCAISAGDTIVAVRSAGPDRIFNTADDIVAPE